MKSKLIILLFIYLFQSCTRSKQTIDPDLSGDWNFISDIYYFDSISQKNVIATSIYYEYSFKKTNEKGKYTYQMYQCLAKDSLAIMKLNFSNDSVNILSSNPSIWCGPTQHDPLIKGVFNEEKMNINGSVIYFYEVSIGMTKHINIPCFGTFTMNKL